jgi:hypothetical protein
MPASSRLLFAVLAASLIACGGDGTTTPTVPTESAGIAGRITSVVALGNYAGTIRVEAEPTSPTSGAKAMVTVVNASTILTLDRKEGDFRSLSTGQWVRVWFSGAVALSYPVQGTAATVVIDSAGTSVNK